MMGGGVGAKRHSYSLKYLKVLGFTLQAYGNKTMGRKVDFFSHCFKLQFIMSVFHAQDRHKLDFQQFALTLTI